MDSSYKQTVRTAAGRQRAATSLMTAVIVTTAVLLGGCADESAPAPVVGFVLPEGDAEKGEAVFLELGCRQCHVVEGKDYPPYEGTSSLEIKLGGTVLRVKNYGELLTSVVNPAHVISPQYSRLLTEAEESRGNYTPMPNFNERMTVAQLIDLVTFLDEQYVVHLPEYSGYHYMP